jgi:di/tricarboxylate transporter
VIKLMDALDADGSGEIGRPEFSAVIETLLKQTSGRIVTQMGLTILCPVSAGYVCAALKYFLAPLASGVLALVPASLIAASARLPSTMDEQIVCGMMMLSINPALAMVDAYAERTAAARVKQA